MPYYAIGPVVSDVLTARQIVFALSEATAPAAPDGQQRIDVSEIVANNPPALVGRQIDISTPATPTLVAVDPLASRRVEWLGRVGAAYRGQRDAAKWWWPDDFPLTVNRRRSRDVIQYELPHWCQANVAALAGAIAGRAWTGMTATQIETAVVHFEAVDVEAWYRLGIVASATAYEHPDFMGGRMFTSYANPLTVSAGYSDTFSVESGVLTPRDPDYSWTLLGGYSAPPADFNPERPA